MTVQKLIDLLMTIPDKNSNVIIALGRESGEHDSLESIEFNMLYGFDMTGEIFVSEAQRFNPDLSGDTMYPAIVLLPVN